MDIYGFLYAVYDFYNRELFSGELPYVVITLEMREGVRGYFSPSRFTDRKENFGQLCINPSYFKSGNEKRVFSTIVHEMCHIYMKAKGENVVKGYHSKAWALKMESVGLLPTSDGTKEGKKTGLSMTHLIIKGGLFERKTGILMNERGMKFSLFSAKDYASEAKAGEKAVPGTRVKYECACSSFWGKKGMDVTCNKCGKKFQRRF